MKDKNENKSVELNGDTLEKVNAGLDFDESDYDIVYKKDDDGWKPDEPARPGTYTAKIKS